MTNGCSRICIGSLFFALLLLIAIPGCKKEDGKKTSDEILVTDPEPDIYIGTHDDVDIGQFYMDLDHDSIDDFLFYAGAIMPYPGVSSGSYYTIYVFGSNLVLGNDPAHAKRLLEHDCIIPDSCTDYHDEYLFLNSTPGPSYYAVEPATEKYLGLCVTRNGQHYFGWVMLDWDVEREVIRIRNYAIQKNPDTPIRTGETSH